MVQGVNRVVLAAFVALSACGPASPSSPRSEELRSWVVPATAGARGGNGGAVVVRSAQRETPPVDVRDLFTASPGLGGRGGRATLGKSGAEGRRGDEGEVEVRVEQFVFDSTGIDPQRVIEANDRRLDFSLRDTASPLPVLEVERFRVGQGSNLLIGCDVRIRARHFVIEKDARLIVRARTSKACTVQVGALSVERNGGLGGQLFVEAERIEVAGTIDVSGNAGAEDTEGGSGGALLLRSTQLLVASTARVVAHGGNGGAGHDERPLNSAPE